MCVLQSPLLAYLFIIPWLAASRSSLKCSVPCQEHLTRLAVSLLFAVMLPFSSSSAMVLNPERGPSNLGQQLHYLLIVCFTASSYSPHIPYSESPSLSSSHSQLNVVANNPLAAPGEDAATQQDLTQHSRGCVRCPCPCCCPNRQVRPGMTNTG